MLLQKLIGVWWNTLETPENIFYMQKTDATLQVTDCILTHPRTISYRQHSYIIKASYIYQTFWNQVVMTNPKPST